MAKIKYYGKGGWLGLPEFGITETLGGKTESLEKAAAQKAAAEKQTNKIPPVKKVTAEPSVSDTSVQEIPEETPSSSSSSSSSSKKSSSKKKTNIKVNGVSPNQMLRGAGIDPSQKKSLFRKYGVDNTLDLLEALKSEEKKKLKERQKKAEDIGKAWDPVLAEMERQLGVLPQRQSEYEGKIQEMATQQEQQVASSEAQSKAELEENKKKGLRELEQDIRNQMEAAGRFIGGLGGGSSSAVTQATEAIVSQGQRARGNLLSEVTSKLADISNSAAQAKAQVAQWRTNQLMNLSQKFSDQYDQLSTASAEAKGARAKAIEGLKMDLEREFTARMEALDSQSIEYLSAIESAERTQQMELEKIAASQEGIAGGSLKDITDVISAFRLLTSPEGGGMSAEDAKTLLEGEGYAIPKGLGEEQKDAFSDEYGNWGTSVEKEDYFKGLGLGSLGLA